MALKINLNSYPRVHRVMNILIIVRISFCSAGNFYLTKKFEEWLIVFFFSFVFFFIILPCLVV